VADKRERNQAQEEQSGTGPVDAPSLSAVAEAIRGLTNTLQAVDDRLAATAPRAASPSGTSASIVADITVADHLLELINAALALDTTPIVIDSVTPSEGNASGGETVTITGRNFVPGVSVFFGDNAATDVKVVDDAHITAKTPPVPPAVAPGSGDVTVDVTVTFGDAAVKPGAFKYRRRA
jgi:hypothetical protein